MNILSLDCSASSVSCALFQNEKLIGEYFHNLKVTHSQTLLPMVDNLLKTSGISPSDIDCFAISEGPGSFTGVRIGISAVKGLAMPNNTDCIGVSTLEAMAYNLIDFDCLVCSTMDARCGQLYCAVFEIKGNCVKRLTDDLAIMVEEYIEIVKGCSKSKVTYAVGDGAEIFYNKAKHEIANLHLASDRLRYQNAVGVGLCAIEKLKTSQSVKSCDLQPRYLRLPQAERELNNKGKRKNV